MTPADQHRILAEAELERQGPGIPLGATPMSFRLAVSVGRASTVLEPSWPIDTPVVITSWRAESDGDRCWIDELRFGQVFVLRSPIPTTQAGTSPAPSTTLWDTAQTRSGGRRGWAMRGQLDAISALIRNTSGEDRVVQLMLECYSPPASWQHGAELLTALER